LEEKMAHWIDIEEGTYRAEEAFLLTPRHAAMALEDVMVEVYHDNNNQRRVRGRAMATGMHMVELLEDDDDLHLLLDLGDQFKFLLHTPSIRAGKTFSPDDKSLLQIAAQGPLEKLDNPKYKEIRSKLVLLEAVK
jgi:hypothetical protein